MTQSQRHGTQVHVIEEAHRVAARQQLPVVSISRLTHTALWILVLVLYFLNATFLLILATLYGNSTAPNSLLNHLMAKYVSTPHRHFVQVYHLVIAATFGGLAALYMYPPAMMISLSYRQRRLAFQPDPIPPRHHTPPHRLGQIFHRLRAAMRSVHVLGPQFPRFLLAVELCEITVQTVQGYRLSTTTGNVTLNLMYGVLICVNCCSTPIIHYVWDRKKHQELLGRLVCVVIDGLLDLAWGAAFQGYTLMHCRSYLLGNYADGNSEDYINEVLDQMMVVSFTNLGITCLPFITSLLVLTELREALASAQMVSIRLRPWKTIEVKAVNATKVQSPAQNVRTSRLNVNWLHIMLCVYGGVILLLSMVSVGVFSPTPQLDSRCGGILFPWGRGPTCVDHIINCTDRNIVGRRQEIAAALHDIVPSMAHIIDIYECPELEMPTSIGPLTNLEWITIIDSTIVGWPDEDAMTILTPQMTYINLESISFDCDSAKCMYLPKLVTVMDWTNMDGELAFEMIFAHWSSVTYYSCSQCNLTSVPPLIFQMNDMTAVVLDGNFIEALPEDGLGPKDALWCLSLIANPINDLPATLWTDLPALTRLYMQLTNISAVPRLAPIVGQESPTVFANSTPLCGDAQRVGDLDWPMVDCINTW